MEKFKAVLNTVKEAYLEYQVYYDIALIVLLIINIVT
jgi:hypothetical protein